MSDGGRLQLDVVTPRGVALSARVDEVIAPSVAGEFGVLPGHVPLLAALDTGLLRYREGNEVTEVAVGGGFVEIAHDAALLLTDRFITKDKVDVLAVRERLAEVDQKLERWEGDGRDPVRLELIAEEQWLVAQLDLIGDHSAAKVLEPSRGIDFAAVMPEREAPEAAAGTGAADEGHGEA
jgi:F-type H+-transporting ATPase subunit epsilon